jgi:hypothetical protein
MKRARGVELTEAEEAHVRVLRLLTERRRLAVMLIAESFADMPRPVDPEVPETSPRLRLVINNDGAR